MTFRDDLGQTISLIRRQAATLSDNVIKDRDDTRY